MKLQVIALLLLVGAGQVFADRSHDKDRGDDKEMKARWEHKRAEKEAHRKAMKAEHRAIRDSLDQIKATEHRLEAKIDKLQKTLDQHIARG